MSEVDLASWAYGSAVVVLWLLMVFFSILAALLVRSGPIRLRHWAENAGDVLRGLFHRPAEFEAFRFLLGLAARLLPIGVVAVGWKAIGGSRPDLFWLLIGALLTSLALIEWFSQRLVEWHAEKTLQGLTGATRLIYGLLRFPIWAVSPFVAFEDDSDDDEDDEDDDEASEGEIDAFIDVGLREGILEPEEEDLVRSIVDFSDTQVRSVMTPRVEITAAPSSSTLEELAEVFFESKHARLPLYGDSIDQIVGIVHIRDLFSALHQEDGERETIALCHPPHYVPESKPLGKLLEELQAMHQQMAIVVDEYGGVAGLVTVEDLVEEIVGEINDEHETVNPDQVRLKDGSWRVHGRTHIEDLAEIFEVDFNGLPYETVSGLICGELGFVPDKGQTFESHGLTMVVEEADERRVEAVTVRHLKTPSAVEQR